MPSINPQIGTSHEATPIAKHEKHRCAELVGGAESKQHVVSLPLALDSGFLKCLCGRGCADIARRERVHSNQWHSHARTPFGG